MAPSTQKLNAISSGLMGIFFGTAIVYVISRLIAVQRRVSTLEQHMTRKVEEDAFASLVTRMDEVSTAFTTISSDVKRILTETTTVEISPPSINHSEHSTLE